jgi:hypothetical protein
MSVTRASTGSVDPLLNQLPLADLGHEPFAGLHQVGPGPVDPLRDLFVGGVAGGRHTQEGAEDQKSEQEQVVPGNPLFARTTPPGVGAITTGQARTGVGE